MLCDRRRRLVAGVLVISSMCKRLVFSFSRDHLLASNVARNGRHRNVVDFLLTGTEKKQFVFPARRRLLFSQGSVLFYSVPASDGFVAGEQSELAKNTVDEIPKASILEQSDHYLVVAKPPSVLCHHSAWAGSRSDLNRQANSTPMVQRVRDTLGGRRVNLVHRLDRGASGCLLFTYADDELNATTILSNAIADKTMCTKTYLALVRGEGIFRGRIFKDEGWFMVERPITDENGIEREAATAFRFVAGQHNDSGKSPEKARASLVLARPFTGRWHQIRKHLNGLSHPILGDSTHGQSRVNREWKEKRGLPSERICLHLSRLQFDPTPACPDGIDVHCPLPQDMLRLLKEQLPDVLREAESVLREEGILLSD